MSKSSKPELARAINQQAHMLAAMSFANNRLKLQELARAQMREGKSIDETILVIRTVGMPSFKDGR